ncbi:calcium sensor EFh [Kerstersia gyiorum]|uniref:Calcium sensor EFh n=1 Tax=Kerstersia gyiorum TaxID=206506 RepID=A0A171KRH5_9BURK|nr:calcium sensor EFh [Kerstersia gyiorum]AZV95375.1 calcium sensor EFh [Bordetella sp. J329]KAB0544532.1 EF-hand domain-containing protein [Kerstersia gyiorum]KKO71492.1 calcium sensor EFh [Kerstersia gyiorum]MCH4271006.1 EF-hand domain-containing protein [Kerstersia gyiorum]MCI1229997.1 EF-hand domain-containing protein [Kerstersia gyiorum]
MKRIVLSTLAGVLLAAGTAAQAQTAVAPGLKLSPEQMQRLDKDKSGDVSRQEYQEFMEASFTRLDANQDGVLDRSELPANVTDEQFAAMDVNRDGKVTRAEFMNQVMADYDEAARQAAH